MECRYLIYKINEFKSFFIRAGLGTLGRSLNQIGRLDQDEPSLWMKGSFNHDVKTVFAFLNWSSFNVNGRYLKKISKIKIMYWRFRWKDNYLLAGWDGMKTKHGGFKIRNIGKYINKIRKKRFTYHHILVLWIKYRYSYLTLILQFPLRYCTKI